MGLGGQDREGVAEGGDYGYDITKLHKSAQVLAVCCGCGLRIGHFHSMNIKRRPTCCIIKEDMDSPLTDIVIGWVLGEKIGTALMSVGSMSGFNQ